MSNTSATGGYLQPAPQALYPGSLTFQQFIQTVLVGISGLPGDLVRPNWQVDPPKQPDIFTNWLAFGVRTIKSDTFIYNAPNTSNVNQSQRMEELELMCSFYGPESESFCSLTRDGFQINQNLEALGSANMGFAYSGDMSHVPDLVNERWVNRFDMNVFLRREVLRTYPILSFVAASGAIKTVINQELKTVDWSSTF